ncbi:MAG: transglutaminase-like domain-containing protein [bacterium]|nr:transglutaminase-like domain-containing protein [bacterium]
MWKTDINNNMFCRYCGNSINKQFSYCNKCGKQLNAGNDGTYENKYEYPKIKNKYRKEFIGKNEPAVQFTKLKPKSNWFDKITKQWRIFFIVVLLSLLLTSIGYFISENSISNKESFPIDKITPFEVTYEWQYGETTYSITETLYQNIYNYYNNKYHIREFIEPISFRDYAINFTNNMIDIEDDTYSNIIEKIKEEVGINDLSDDVLLEVIVSMLQSFEYDEAKFAVVESAPKNEIVGDAQSIIQIEQSWPRFPYETLFDNKGICTDMSFLTISFLKELGYGYALFDFPVDNHLAPAVQCPKEYSNYNSGYCYIEPTSLGFKIGVSSDIDVINGEAKVRNDRTHNSSVDVIVLEQGKEYTKVSEIFPQIKELNRVELDYTVSESKLTSIKSELNKIETNVDRLDDEQNRLYNTHEILKSEFSYNTYIVKYNQYEYEYNRFIDKTNEYNTELEFFNQYVEEYNNLINILYGTEIE